MVKIRQNLLPQSLYSWKSPYKMTPTRIVVHNSANDASADEEIKFMHKTKAQGGVQVSYQYAVDDIEVVQGLPENRNGWHAGDGDGKGNREGIGIEICYSYCKKKVNGNWVADEEKWNKYYKNKFIKAEQNAVELIVDILKRYGWGIDKVTKHQDYMNKYCPHRTLDMGWDRFLKMIQDELDKDEKEEVKPTENKVNIYYQVETKEDGVLPMVKNLEDYAGWKNHAIRYLAMKVDVGTIKYRITTVSGKTLGWITRCDIRDHNLGCAGNGEPIATVEVMYYTPEDIVKKSGYKYVYYKVNNYSYQKDMIKSQMYDGYAGVQGVIATKFQAYIDN